jgi:heme oxygenase (mycobilin-producing)
VLVMNRFVVEEADAEAFVERAHAALATLAARPGYQRGRLTRALDDPRHWCLVTEWESVGAYRRALNAFEVRFTRCPCSPGPSTSRPRTSRSPSPSPAAR